MVALSSFRSPEPASNRPGPAFGYTWPMPLPFSYGSLQQEEVQQSTVGRRLHGTPDAIVGFEPSLVPIEDPEVAAAVGKTHHANATFTGNETSRVPGTVFEITDDELAQIDKYEAAFSYTRVTATLVSGRHTWVYVDERGA